MTNAQPVSTLSSGAPGAFGLSVDVEDYFQVWAFSDVIRRESWDGFEMRAGEMTRACLDMFDRSGVKATFFTLGWVAERDKALVREIIARGHEIASHGYDHASVNRQTRNAFLEDAGRAKKLIEDIGGVAVNGYRAANFSIDRTTPWAHETLERLGYRYSSSVHPAAHDHYGDPRAEQKPFRPVSGSDFIEAPVATATILGSRISCAGGGRFRASPLWMSKLLLRRAARAHGGPVIFYFHPWEIDGEQPRIRRASTFAKFRHYFNIGGMPRKLENIFSAFSWRRIDETLGLARAGEAA